jgi:hypothetical protein
MAVIENAKDACEALRAKLPAGLTATEPVFYDSTGTPGNPDAWEFEIHTGDEQDPAFSVFVRRMGHPDPTRSGKVFGQR